MLSRLWQVDAAAEAQLMVRRVSISSARSKSGDMTVPSIKFLCVCWAEITLITWYDLRCSLLPAASLSRLVYVGSKSGKWYHREAVRQSAWRRKCAGQDVSVREHLRHR